MIASSVLNSRASAAIFLLLTVLGALALQHGLGWAPCPLCIVQRLTALALLGFLAGYAMARREHTQTFMLICAALAAGAGLTAAGMHLYLLFSPQTETCGPGLASAVTRLVETLPGSEWLLEGAGACGDTRYAIFWIPLPAWSGAAHAIALAIAAWHWLKRPT